MVLNLALNRKKRVANADSHAMGDDDERGEIVAAPAGGETDQWTSSDISVETKHVVGGMTVGCFDVFHRGHKALIEKLMSISDIVSIGCVSCFLALRIICQFASSSCDTLDSLWYNDTYLPCSNTITIPLMPRRLQAVSTTTQASRETKGSRPPTPPPAVSRRYVQLHSSLST